MSKLHYSGIWEVAERIKSGKLSPLELTRHMLDRIDTIDKELKSFARVWEPYRTLLLNAVSFFAALLGAGFWAYTATLNALTRNRSAARPDHHRTRYGTATRPTIAAIATGATCQMPKCVTLSIVQDRP